ASQADRLRRRGRAGAPGPYLGRPEGPVEVEPRLSGVHDEGHVMPITVVGPGDGQRARGSVPRVVGGVPEVPGAQLTVLGVQVVAAERRSNVLVHDPGPDRG